MVSRILVVALVVCTANAATWMGYLPEKPKELAHKEGCYVEEINDVVPFGTEVKPIGHCVRIHCGSPMMDYASCGVVGTDDPKCYVTKGDLTKPYPDCCPDVECDFDNDVCGKASTDDPKCHVTKVDLTKRHPDCCPHIECDFENYV